MRAAAPACGACLWGGCLWSLPRAKGHTLRLLAHASDPHPNPLWRVQATPPCPGERGEGGEEAGPIPEPKERGWGGGRTVDQLRACLQVGG